MEEDDLFPTAAQLADDFKRFAPTRKKVTVYDIDPDDGSTTAAAAGVMAIKLEHLRTRVSVGDGSVPDERCPFWLTAEDIGSTVWHPDRILDADGETWKVDSADYRTREALIYCECTRVRS